MSGTRELVFVYGTLKRGGSNHFRMSGADFMTAGVVRGNIYQISWYPGLVLGDEGDVHGEVYSVDAGQLLELDAFEGLSAGEIEGTEYRRVKTVVFKPDGSTLPAWAWEWLGEIDPSRWIESGDWLSIEPGDS